uniref:NADH-ubiquinone oxidoreductase chain 2 n=1 Tax=Vaejovis mexicanus smithi TaxID=1562928 RepID=A0A343AXY5_VAEMS|nr:NADH dehydrogenase subunit 2 [Vaejovis smithi]APW29069.1 NADH dehydrogenase subunit 2 [Vaejovis smithi]
MMFPLHYLFMLTLIFGSFVAINSSSWLVAWMGLEMNLLSFLPLMASEKSSGGAESCIKYFLVQSMASLMILISSVFVFSILMFNSVDMIFIGLSIKLGVAPFHYWFPSVMEGLNWICCMVLMTWQKLAPLFLMSFVNLMMLMVIVTALVGAFGGFGQYSFKKILAFSSINHIGWMLGGMMYETKVGMIYFLIYVLMSMLIVLTFMSFSIFSLNQMMSVSYFLSVMTLINLLSLGGMPPFLGFFPKWLIIEKIFWVSFFFASILIFSSLVSLYFYLRVCYPILLLQFLGSEDALGGTFLGGGMMAFFFLSSGGVFFYPLLSSI